MYEWTKAIRMYNDQGCYFQYDLHDPNYGDRTVYMMDTPTELEADVFFKYSGVPMHIEPIYAGGSWGKGYSWRFCDNE